MVAIGKRHHDPQRGRRQVEMASLRRRRGGSEERDGDAASRLSGGDPGRGAYAFGQLAIVALTASPRRLGRRPRSATACYPRAGAPYFSATGSTDDLAVIANLAETLSEDEPGSRPNG